MVTSYKDIIDIIIVAFVIYRIILLIRGTRAVQMLLGLAFVIIIFFVSQFFKLHTLHWILDIFFSSIILIIIVIFQDDIRRALTRVGKNPFFSTFNHENRSQIIEHVIKSAITLSKRHIGALIVIEGQTGLREYIERGAKVDALLSSELLVSIFLPTSPLHDGAVIIKKEKIAAAGCFLPLTLNENVGKIYGTRHRAAIGISERTDAAVVVVSEETGQISVSSGGQIISFSDELKLKDFLSKSLGIR